MGRLHAQKEHGWMDDTTLISKKKKERSRLVAKNTMRLNAYIAQTPTATVQANVSATARESRRNAALACAIACGCHTGDETSRLRRRAYSTS